MKLLLKLYLFFFTCSLIANQHYENNLRYAKGAGLIRSKEKFQASDYCKRGDYVCIKGVSKPSEKSFNESQLKQKGLALKERDPTASAVSTAIINRPDIDITSSQDLQDAVLVMNSSYEITHGMPNRYTDCKVQSQSCTDCQNNQMICGEKSFCLDGECDTGAKSRNQDDQLEDFQKNASALAAINAAGKSLENASVRPTMFTGKPMKCGGDTLAFSKCCKDSGWGLSLGISDCSEEEKQLGKAKEKGVAVYLGKYCSKKIPLTGICIKRKKGYCVFENKLAYIIQTQGRKGQLNISMGSAKHPNCRGITSEEMQDLDFSKVDFSSFYSELNQKTPSPQFLQNTMAQKLRSKM